VQLTPKGTELLSAAAPVFDSELERLLRAPLAGAALKELADALGALRKSAAAQPASQANRTSESA
jgi:hypothetical protein